MLNPGANQLNQHREICRYLNYNSQTQTEYFLYLIIVLFKEVCSTGNAYIWVKEKNGQRNYIFNALNEMLSAIPAQTKLHTISA